jgi:hypothetical protein
VIAGREPADSESQYFDGRAHLAGSLASHEIAGVLQVSSGLIVVAPTQDQFTTQLLNAENDKVGLGVGPDSTVIIVNVPAKPVRLAHMILRLKHFQSIVPN